MDLQWFITFKAILDTGSFTNAAEKLGYTQSTVTSHIRQLENEFSVKLFDKIGRNMYLSDSGRRMLPKIDQIMDLVTELKIQTSKVKTYSGTLRLGIVETVLLNNMQRILHDFMEKAPQVELNIINSSCYTTREALKRGDLDIGILYMDTTGRRADPLLNEVPLTEVPLVMVGSGTKDSFWDMEKGLPLADLTYYFNDPRCVFHEIYKDYLADHGIVSKKALTMGNMETQLKMIEAGNGISYLPRFVVEKRLKSGSLRELPMDTSEKSVYIAYAMHKNKSISPAMSLFIELIKATPLI